MSISNRSAAATVLLAALIAVQTEIVVTMWAVRKKRRLRLLRLLLLPVPGQVWVGVETNRNIEVAHMRL